jgi:threonine/homoserine/homoserine lactone efflux protein
MGLGGLVYAVLAMLGLKAVFASHPWLYTLVKLGGGAYLLYIGIIMWRHARSPLAALAAPGAERSSAWRAFALAAATQLSNPKTAVFYASIFAALLPRSPGLLFTLLLPLAVFLIEIGWYTIVALVLSAAGPRAVYLRAKTAIDRTGGGIMGLLGIKLVTAADTAI